MATVVSLILEIEVHRQILLVDQILHQIKSLILNEQCGRKLTI